MQYSNQIYQVALEKKIDFIGFAIYSNGRDLGFSFSLSVLQFIAVCMQHALCENMAVVGNWMPMIWNLAKEGDKN